MGSKPQCQLLHCDKVNMDITRGPLASLIIACMDAHMYVHSHTNSHTHTHTLRHPQPCWVICFVQWVIHVLACSVVINWCGWLCRQNWFLVQAIKHNATAFHCQNLQGHYLEKKLMPLLNRFMDNVIDTEKTSLLHNTHWAVVLLPSQLCLYSISTLSSQYSCIHVYCSNLDTNRWFSQTL